MKARLVCLASGSGTNCQAILDACDSGQLDAEVVAVVTNRPGAGVVARAETAGVGVDVVDQSEASFLDRVSWDQKLIEVVGGYTPDLVILAGWMRILAAEFGNRFPTINLHPAKAGEFPGTHAIERAHQAWLSGEITETGVMVHWVPDAGVDTGPVVVEVSVAFRADESLAELEQRIHIVEHKLIVEGIRAALVTSA